MIDWKEMKEIIGSFGFPIFIAIWLLWERRNIGNLLINRMDRLIQLLENPETTRRLERRQSRDNREDE